MDTTTGSGGDEAERVSGPLQMSETRGQEITKKEHPPAFGRDVDRRRVVSQCAALL